MSLASYLAHVAGAESRGRDHRAGRGVGGGRGAPRIALSQPLDPWVLRHVFLVCPLLPPSCRPHLPFCGQDHLLGKDSLHRSELLGASFYPGVMAVTAVMRHPDPATNLRSSGPQEASRPGGVRLWF